jgi:hypothetical protein
MLYHIRHVILYSEDFSSILCVHTGSGAHPAFCTMGTVGPSPGGKAQPGRDTDHLPPSSAEVKNELELYLLSPQAPSWRVVGQLYFFTIFYSIIYHSILYYIIVMCCVITYYVIPQLKRIGVL